MKTLCPACGSSDIETSEESRTLPIPYYDPINFCERISFCKSCGMRGDFSEDENNELKNQIALAKKESVTSMLDWLAQHDITMAYIERALDLPTRTVNRWRSKATSASGVALIQMVRTYPWILEVAGSGFSEEFARNKLIEEATREYIHTSSQGTPIECSVMSYPIADGITGIHVILDCGTPPEPNIAYIYGPKGERELCNYSIS